MRHILVVAVIFAVTCQAQTATTDSPTKEYAASSEQPQTSSIAPSDAKAEQPKAPKLPPGFRARVVKGATVYCQKTPVLGSRFAKEICLDEVGLKQYQDRAESMRRDLSTTSRICAGTAGACGNE